MSGKAAKIELTQTMYDILTRVANSRTLPGNCVVRANMILQGFHKTLNQDIAKQVNQCAETVGKWRRRWRDSYDALLLIQLHETQAALRRAILLCLADAPRCGAPGKFTADQVTGLIGIACESPQASGRPVTSWTSRELADECSQRNLIDSISRSQVNRLLREVDLQPHRRRYWCFTTEKNRELFQQQVEAVCRTYLEASWRYQQSGTRTISVDEMTGLQANERRAPTKLPCPGQLTKEEFQYTRHGTVCVTANWDVVQGQLLATTIGVTRDNDDFAGHIRQTVATDPTAPWVFVLDNLNTHCGEPLVRTVAKLLGIDPSTLGVKRRHGVLKTMASRREFLSDVDHRIRFVYLPKHSSWLNQIEIIFGVINRRLMRGGSFKSQADLSAQLLSFIAYYNDTFAKPMTWTYTGRPTRTKPPPRPNTWRETRQPRATRQEVALVRMNL